MHTKQGEVKKDVKMCKTTFFRLPFSQKGSLHVKNQHKIAYWRDGKQSFVCEIDTAWKKLGLLYIMLIMPRFYRSRGVQGKNGTEITNKANVIEKAGQAEKEVQFFAVQLFLLLITTVAHSINKVSIHKQVSQILEQLRLYGVGKRWVLWMLVLDMHRLKLLATAKHGENWFVYLQVLNPFMSSLVVVY